MEDSEQVLARFNRLVRDLERGTLTRNCFRPWEIDLLLDMDTCELQPSRKWQILRQYQKAVQRQLEKGASRPLKLSEYLQHKLARRTHPSAMPRHSQAALS